MASQSWHRAGQAEEALPTQKGALHPQLGALGCLPNLFPHQDSFCLQALQWKPGRWVFCFAAQLRFLSCREQQVCMGTAEAGSPVCTRTDGAAERFSFPPSTRPKLHIPLCQPSPSPLGWEMGTGHRHLSSHAEQAGGHGQVQGSSPASIPWSVVSLAHQYPAPCWHLSSLADPSHIRNVANTRCSETPQTHACFTPGVRPDCPQNKEIPLQEHLGRAKGWERAGTQRALLVCFEPEMEKLSMGALSVKEEMYKRQRRSIGVSTGSARGVCWPKLHPHTPRGLEHIRNQGILAKPYGLQSGIENSCEHKHMDTCTHTEFWRGIKSQPSNQNLLKARGLDAQLVHITHPPTKPEEIGQRNIC